MLELEILEKKLFIDSKYTMANPYGFMTSPFP